MTIRKLILQLHLWLGLTSGLVVFIVATTGALYVFDEEGRELFQHKYYHVTVPENASRLPLTQLTDTFLTRYPKDKITSIRWKETKDAAVIFFTKKRLVSIDPYTGSIAGVRNVNKDYFTVVQKIHTELLLGEVGKEIVRWNVLIFFIMCISGLILWWPRQRKFFKQAITINFRAKSWKRVNWDLHQVLGFYALLVLLIISLTGLFWTFDTAKNIVAFITRSPLPEKEMKTKVKPIPGKHFTLDEAYSYASLNYPGARETFVTPPADSTAPIRIIMRYPYTLVRKQNTFFLSPYNGKLLKAELYTNYTGYDKVARSNYDLHTGHIHALGIGSKIIWFLAALMAASLPVTGFLIWWGRRRKIKKPAHVYAPARNTPVAAVSGCG